MSNEKKPPIKLLLVDDEPKNVRLLAELLTQEGFLCGTATSFEEAVSTLADEQFAIGIFDLKLGEVETGIRLIREASEQYPEMGIIVLSAFGDYEENVEQALKTGADFFLDKIFDKRKLLNTIRSTIEKVAYRRKNIHQRHSILANFLDDGIIGKSKAIQDLKEKIVQVSNQRQAIFIYGESGVGKEIVARAIHYHSARRDFPFIDFNCTALNNNLIENELFGHVLGAFTDAKNDKAGFFEVADGGTLFIDEIGDMAEGMQAKILKVIENKELNRVGSEKKIKVDIQIITASNKDLEALVANKSFRNDLFYRIRQNYIFIPPLRDRKDDIPLLVGHFIAAYAKSHRLRKKVVSARALDWLMNYDFPGNIRELKTIIEMALGCSRGDAIEIEDLGISLDKNVRQGALPVHFLKKPFADAISEFEKIYVENRLKETHGNIAKAAEKADMARSVFYDKLKKYNIDPKHFQ